LLGHGEYQLGKVYQERRLSNSIRRSPVHLANSVMGVNLLIIKGC
jgi:hypothetical protein